MPSYRVAGRKILYYVAPNGQQSPIRSIPDELLLRIFELAIVAEEKPSNAGDELEYLSRGDLPQVDWDLVALGVEAKPNLAELLKDTELAQDDRRKWHWLDEWQVESRNVQQAQPLQERISHVCRGWRSIALGFANFWATLTFTDKWSTERSREWIIRSKQAPLHIRIFIKIPELSGYGLALLDGAELRRMQLQRNNLVFRGLECLFDILIPHVAHWGSFDFTTPNYEFIIILLRRLATCGANPGALQLEKLAVKFFGSFQNVADSEDEIRGLHLMHKRFFLFGGNVPRLASVEFNAVHIDWESLISPGHRSVRSQEYSYPSSSITRLVLRHYYTDFRPSLSQFVRMFACAPALAELSLSYGAGWLTSVAESLIDTAFVPALKILSLSGVNVIDALAILDMLYAPAITVLHFQFEGTQEDFAPLVPRLLAPMRLPTLFSTPEAKAAFIPQGPQSILTNVRNLSVSGLLCSDAQVHDLYGALDALVVLQVDMSGLSSLFLSLLMPMTTPINDSCYMTPANSTGFVTSVFGTGKNIHWVADNRAPAPSTINERIRLPLPNLKKLVIGGMYVQGESLVDLAQARSWYGHPLLLLNVRYDVTITEHEYSMLRRCVRQVGICDNLSTDLDELSRDGEV